SETRAADHTAPPRPPALDDRARLPTAQRRARARPLRRPQLPRLPPPHRARHLRARLPHRGTPAPASPAAGLTLPRAGLLLPPLPPPQRPPSPPRPGGRSNAAAGGAAPAARPALLGRPLPHLPATRRPQPTGALPPQGVTKYY